MSEYKGKPVAVAKSAADIYARITDFSQYEQAFQSLPEEHRAKVENVSFSKDSFSISVPQIGEVKFVIKDSKPGEYVVYEASNSPMPISVEVRMHEFATESTEITPVVKVKLPPMLETFVGGKLREAADKVGELFTTFLR